VIKIYLTLLFVLFFGGFLFAQNKTDSLKKDSSGRLTEVMVTGYLSNQRQLTVPASVAILTPDQLKLQPDNSLVSAMNTVPGVRMEERSPGSYRLSIRGSLLRSPFGIRDIKIYYDELPLTDAGGNTYLNAIDFNSVQGVEILKGPDGSLFGANSGGVVLINPIARYSDTSFLSAGYDGGSYSLEHENVAYQYSEGHNQFNFNQAHESYGGYRQNSAMYRNYFQATDRLSYNTNDDIKAIAFYSDLHYETPGGLTLAQDEADPQDARFPTATLPGSIQAQAAIGTRMWFGGAVNNYHITDNIRNVLAVYGSYVEFYNPFITNYETRYEGTYGVRTYFELTGKQTRNYNWQAFAGLEWQQTDADINNYGNTLGERDTAQTLDKINTDQHFFFGRYSANFFRKLHVEAAMSLNYYDYEFRNLYPNDETGYTNRPFNPELMPRIAASYQIFSDLAWRASVSRGYSTPTTAEIRPTDNVINTSLQAEYGWNYETGFRLKNNDETMFLDASVFYYKLQNAIILHINPNETETYLNSGGTNQPGFELYYSWWIIRQNTSSFIRGLQFNESATIDKFTFSTTHDQLTGVPQQVYISSLQLDLPSELFLFVEHNYTAKLPLNDANTVFAPYYNLLAAKAGWQHIYKNPKGGDHIDLEIYAGADNILNTKYSLGDDLNAVGSRYYNPAPLRNYYLGLKVGI
jgi:iron complex outermembrane receptor protein